MKNNDDEPKMSKMIMRRDEIAGEDDELSDIEEFYLTEIE